MKQNTIRIPMPIRYLINLLLTVALWGVLAFLVAEGVITNYWSGILVTVGINIILAVSLNVDSCLWAMPVLWRWEPTPAAST